MDAVKCTHYPNRQCPYGGGCQQVCARNRKPLPAPKTLSLPEPTGWHMAESGELATRMDFIRAKLGTGDWPVKDHDPSNLTCQGAGIKCSCDE